MNLRKPFLLLGCLVSSCMISVIYGQEYLDMNPPGKSPEVFAPGLISQPERYEFGSIFSKNGLEFFFAVEGPEGAEILSTSARSEEWTTPETIISGAPFGFNDPFLSPDEQELYYISNRPIEESGSQKDYDIWYSKRTAEGWSSPINAGENINTNRNEYYISFTSKGTMYFSSNKAAEEGNTDNFDIYSSVRTEKGFQEANKLGNAINSKDYEADVFVAPDESYLIFCAVRKEGLGRGDLYISFKNEDGSWTKAKNMGAPINTEGHELCPFVTSDGKYLFYTSKQDIYWVEASVIEDSKNTYK